MKGVVLCGGYSRRMHTDKAFMRFENKPFLERAIDCLSKIVQEYYLSCRKDQLNIYQPIGSCIPDQEDGEGPLGGILSIISHLDDTVLIMPCDMPLMSIEVLRRLQSVHQSVWDATVYTYQNTVLPFPLIINSHARVKLQKSYETGERSLLSGLSKLDLFRLPATSMDAFRNVNSPEQFNLLKS